MKRYLAFGGLMGLLGLAVGTTSSEWLTKFTQPVGTAYAVQPGVAAGVAPTPNWEVRPGAGNALTPEEQTNIYVYEHANPSVVNINTRSVQIDRFFNMQRESEGSGSGAIIDKQGHILTNSHVVDGANEVEVTLASNKTYTAVLIGEDKEHDIAILKIQAPSTELTPLVLGASEPVRSWSARLRPRQSVRMGWHTHDRNRFEPQPRFAEPRAGPCDEIAHSN